MSRLLDFTKMSAFGNDYIYVIDLEKQLIHRDEVSRILSERNFSIGSDGLMVIEKSDVADFFMRVYNPDGTQAQMCGNGLRSVGKLVYEKGLTDKTEFTIETLGGVKEITLFLDKNGKVENIRADIGVPVFDTSKIPAIYEKDRIIGEEITVFDRHFFATALSLGNPHLALYCEDLSGLDIEKYGKCAEHLSIFPERTNVEFFNVLSKNEISIRTWERGTGETLACATGCCAALCACVLSDMCERCATVTQKGGKTHVLWNDFGHLIMTAPSQIIFEGKVMLDDKYFSF